MNEPKNNKVLDDLKKWKFKFQIWLTSVLGIYSLFIITFQNSDESLMRWAIGIIAFILGYWLK